MSDNIVIVRSQKGCVTMIDPARGWSMDLTPAMARELAIAFEERAYEAERSMPRIDNDKTFAHCPHCHHTTIGFHACLSPRRVTL